MDRTSLISPCCASRHSQLLLRLLDDRRTRPSLAPTGRDERRDDDAEERTPHGLNDRSGRGNGRRHHADIVQLVDLPAQLDDRIDLARRQDEDCLIAELLFEPACPSADDGCCRVIAQRTSRACGRRAVRPPRALILGDGRSPVVSSRTRLIAGSFHRFVGMLAQAALPRTSPTAAP